MPETNPQQLRSLVSLFHANREQYKSNQYDEANTRTDFIDKFFALLDWDVANSQGFSETYRNVVREDKVKIEGSQNTGLQLSHRRSSQILCRGKKAFGQYQRHH